MGKFRVSKADLGDFEEWAEELDEEDFAPFKHPPKKDAVKDPKREKKSHRPEPVVIEKDDERED